MGSILTARALSPIGCKRCQRLLSSPFNISFRACSTRITSVADFIKASQRNKAVNVKKKNTNSSKNKAKRKLVARHNNQEAGFIQSLVDAKEVASRSVLIKSVSPSYLDQAMFELESVASVNRIDCITSKDLAGQLYYDILVEFETLRDFNRFSTENNMEPFVSQQSLLNVRCSRVLRLQAHPKSKIKYQPSMDNLVEYSDSNILHAPNQADLAKVLKKCEELPDAIVSISQALKMTDLQVKLNYLSSNLIDDILTVQFPEASTLPHGSATSSLGNKGTDLDLICHPFGLHCYPRMNRPYYEPPKDEVSPCRLDESRFCRHMVETLSFYIRFFVSGKMNRTLCLSHARVPIVKYIDDNINTDCDLAVTTNVSDGVKASFMLNEMVRHDGRFEHLVRAAKLWSKSFCLYSDGKGQGFTNFSLVHMVLYFMQYNKLLPATTAVYNGDKLYIDFFKFWASFDFSKTIDVSSASHFREDLQHGERGALQIINSQKSGHNISRNTQAKYIELFKSHAKKTHSLLKLRNPVHQFGNLHLKTPSDNR